MKKTVLTLLVIIITIIAIVAPVFAATPTNLPTFKLVCSTRTHEQGVAQSNEITLTYSVNNFKNFANQKDGGKDGINVLKATLEYDETIFEPIEIATTKEGYFDYVSTVNGAGDEALRIDSSNWEGLKYNPKTKELVIDTSKNKFINSADAVFILNLKVKDDATPGTKTNVIIKDIVGSDGKKDINADSVSVEFEILDGITTPIPDPLDPWKSYIRIVPNMKVSGYNAIATIKGTITGPKAETLGKDACIPTGSKIVQTEKRIIKGVETEDIATYVLISVCDITSNENSEANDSSYGKLTATDLSQQKNYEVELTNLNDDQKRACDARWDANYKVSDRSNLKEVLVGMISAQVNVWHCYDSACSAHDTKRATNNELNKSIICKHRACFPISPKIEYPKDAPKGYIPDDVSIL